MTQNVVESRLTFIWRKKKADEQMARWIYIVKISKICIFFSWLNNVWFPYYRLSSLWRFVYASLLVQITTLRSKISSDQRKFKLNFQAISLSENV